METAPDTSMAQTSRASVGDHQFDGTGHCQIRGGDGMVGHDGEVFRSATTSRWLMRAFTTTEHCYQTQAAAVRAGMREAKRRRLDLVIHRRNGRILSEHSNGTQTRGLDSEHKSGDQGGAPGAPPSVSPRPCRRPLVDAAC